MGLDAVYILKRECDGMICEMRLTFGCMRDFTTRVFATIAMNLLVHSPFFAKI